MSDISVGFDDLLDDADHSLRNRLIALSAAALVIGGVAFAVWSTVIRGGGGTAAQAQTATVDRGNITKSISTSGVVSAQQTSSLSFQQGGKVTGVNVGLGQAVKQGDVLATIDPADLQSALDTANMSLASAQSKLSALLQGSTASQLASADQNVVQAQASYDKATRALQDLEKPATATDLATAQQAVTTAQAQLGQAQQARAKLDTSSADAVTAAQALVDKDQKALDKAQTTASTADATVSSAQSTLYTEEDAYCVAPGSSVTFCGSHEAPLSSSNQSLLVGASDTLSASKVLTANTAYVKALSDQQTANDAVDSAESDLQTANTALSKAELGPTAADIASADAAVSAAQVAVASAQSKLDTLQAGPTQEQLDAAQAEIDTASAGLRSAQAKRDETYQGSLPADIQQQRQAVAQAQLSVDQAQRNLDKTKLVAPFDGTVAALNVQVGDNAAGSSGGSSSGSSTAPIILNTPDNVRVDLTISETDLPSVKVGQVGAATFSAIPGVTFPIIIDSIGTNPTTTQGVVNYAVRAHIVSRSQLFTGNAPGATGAPAPTGGTAVAATGAGTPGTTDAAGTPTPATSADTPDAGGRFRGSRTPGAGPQQFSGTPGAGVFGGAAATTKPAPGMNATVVIVVDSRQNVLRLPPSAIQRSGRDSIVEVKQSDGSTQKVTVQTGLTDGQHTEITSGVDEGATVIVPGAVAASSSSGVAGGFGGGGGGNFFIGPGGGGGRADGGGGTRGGG